MLTWIYRLIAFFVSALIVWDLWEEKKILNQMMAGLVLIPLILRFLMIK